MFSYHAQGEIDTVQTVMCSLELVIFKKPQRNTSKCK